jgi:hypothetical protein
VPCSYLRGCLRLAARSTANRRSCAISSLLNWRQPQEVRRTTNGSDPEWSQRRTERAETPACLAASVSHWSVWFIVSFLVKLSNLACLSIGDLSKSHCRASQRAATLKRMPPTAPAPIHLAVVSSHEIERDPIACTDAPTTSVGPLERRSVALLEDADMQTVVASIVETASALVGAGRDSSRLALTAKAIAREQERHHSLARLHDELVICRDLEALPVIAKLLESSNRRLCSLLGEHRASCHVGARAAIVVGHADHVVVDTTR